MHDSFNHQDTIVLQSTYVFQIHSPQHTNCCNREYFVCIILKMRCWETEKARDPGSPWEDRGDVSSSPRAQLRGTQSPKGTRLSWCCRLRGGGQSDEHKESTLKEEPAPLWEKDRGCCHTDRLE